MKVSIKERVLPAVVMTSLIILWEMGVRIFQVPVYHLPAPTDILQAFKEHWRILLEHTAFTFSAAIMGFLIGMILAVIIAIFMSFSKTIKSSVYPLLVITQTVPLVALAPILAVWLGFGILPKIVLSAIVVFFPVVVSTVEGLYSYDRDTDRLLASMKAKPLHVYTKFRIPGALPYFFAGLKTAAAYSIMGAVISEWVGAQKGLGIYLTRALSSFRTAAMFADIVIIVILSIFVFKLVEYIEKKCTSWNIREEI